MRQFKISNRITNRESIALERYLSEISKEDVLSPEEEVELAKRIKQGDQLALEKLVKANLRFVVSVAKQYQNNGLTLNDLINEGNVGLLKAARRFDESRGFKFITFAVWYIRQSILHAIIENSRMIRLPFNKHNTHTQINNTSQYFLQQFEREPTAEEISETFDLKPEDVQTILLGARHLSLNAAVEGNKGDFELVETLSDPNTEGPDFKLLRDSLKEELQIGLRRLAPREREILVELFGLSDSNPKSYEEVAELLGLSVERVRQLKDHAFRRLRRLFSRSNFLPFED